MQSPYKPAALQKSASGGDLVTGIIDKFNLLSVVDRDEERAQFERQLNKLRSALDRAIIAREEAESEARDLRQQLSDVQATTSKQEDESKACIRDLERKYDKAKERFKQQRSKHEDAIQTVHRENLETEKQHWRQIASVQEEADWERSLRLDAYALVDFTTIEHEISKALHACKIVASASNTEHGAVQREQRSASPVIETSSRSEEDITVVSDAHPQYRARAARPKRRTRSSILPVADQDDVTQKMVQPATMLESAIVEEEQTTFLAAPNMHPRVITPNRQMAYTVPVQFGEDKENLAPPQKTTLPKTPLTIDRAAALAAIQYRRGRTQSFVNSQTPKRLLFEDRRDISAPPLVTMTVGRC